MTVNGSLDLTVGQRIDVAQTGAGEVTIVASGATVNGYPGLIIAGQYGVATIVCTATDTYLAFGDLRAANPGNPD